MLRLAWIEFSLPFRRLRSEAPGGRDFMWLTFLLVLVLTLGLLLQATRVGMLERFVDVFLGTVKNHGVPIWVIPNPFSKGSIKFISNDVIKEIEAGGGKIYPYREVDEGLDVVELPDPSIWKKRTELDPSFSGWAVYLDDPLWPSSYDNSTDTKDFPLTIVINKNLFSKHFDFEKYNSFIRQKLPSTLYTEVTKKNLMSKDPFKNIWLSIRSNGRPDLYNFKVLWVDRIPTIQKVAFLFPLSTYHALYESSNYPELNYFPEYFGKTGQRIKRISVSGNTENTKFKEFLKLTRGAVSIKRGRTLIEFKAPRQLMRIDQYLRDAGLTYRVLDSIQGDILADKKSHLELPCHILPRKELRLIPKKKQKKSDCSMLKDVTSSGNGFLRAFIYVPDRTTLNEAVRNALVIHDKALSIHPIYKDALNRFGFLTKMLDALRLPYGIVLFLFLVAILGIQIGTLVGHRRGRYGIFLAKGISWGQIYQMLYLQISFALIISISLSAIIMTILKASVSTIVGQASNEFREVLSVADMDILPLLWQDYLLVTVGTFILAQFFVTIIVYKLPVHRRTEIGRLLQG